MPIGIGINGGLVRRDMLESVSSDKALDSLQQIRTHLSQPGRDSGVLTLHNRTSTDKEMTLERKSGFQLRFQKKDDRLDDTVHAMKTLLKQAGKDEAVAELEEYLSSQGGKQNRIESSKMFEILNRHLPPLEKGTSMKNLCTLAKIDVVRRLGSGSFGDVSLVKVGGKECVLKEFAPQSLSLVRNSDPNEAMGSYLNSKKPEYSNYLTDKVNIAQPTFYMVSMKKEGRREFQMVTPHEMRSLVKEARKTGSEVLCHGLVMPKAKGKEVGKLIDEGKLTESEKKQFIGSMLQSVKGLNERGFVHRDIKPENSYFDRQSETTTLIDTGSLFKTSKDPQKNPGGEYIKEGFGTVEFLHPRGFRDENHGTETDLYAVGVSALKVDHPIAFEYIMDDIARENKNGDGVTQEWLTRTLDDKIRNTRSQEARDDLIALRDAINNPKSLTAFAMNCFDLARFPAKDWQDREWSQEKYSWLLKHPGLQ